MKTVIGNTSNTPYSPLAIEMLLHFFAICEPYRQSAPETWPRAQQRVLAHFLAQGLVEPTDYGFKTTDKGTWLAKQMTIEFKRLMHGLEMPA